MSENTPQVVSKPRLLFRPHPVWGWSLTPNYSVRVGFRDDVIQTIAADGWRFVPGGADALDTQLAVYGCSFTYGTGLADDETFVALLQQDMPHVKIRSRGIGGQSSVQNYLQFQHDIAQGNVDAAIFAIISDHRFRNIPHPQRMQQFLHNDWHRIGVEHVPVIRQGRDGQNSIQYVPIWQPALKRGGFDAFLPDNGMIDSATLAILEEIKALAQASSIPVVFALLDQLDPGFNVAVQNRFTAAIDISVPLDLDHSFLPRDRHPNQAANQNFAEGLKQAARALVEQADPDSRAARNPT